MDNGGGGLKPAFNPLVWASRQPQYPPPPAPLQAFR